MKQSIFKRPFASLQRPDETYVVRAAAIEGHPCTTTRFEWSMGAYMVLLCVGTSLDNWAHFHGKVDTSFFTPWHALLYGMMAILGIALGATAATNVRRGYAWQRSLPRGYMLSLVGVVAFIIAGLLDLCWHLLFGIEFDTAAYISPPHLLLLASGILAGTGPVRSAFLRLEPRRAEGWLALGPALLSASSAVAAIAMFTVFASPMVDTFAAKVPHGATIAFTTMSYFDANAGSVTGRDLGGFQQAFGVAEVIIQTVLVMGILLVMLHTWRLPFGAVTLFIGLGSTLQALMADNYRLIFGVIVTGLLVDLILMRKKASMKGAQLYAAGCFVPTLYFTTMFAVLWLTSGLVWPATLLAGATVYAAMTGLLLAFLIEWPLRYTPQR